MAEIQCPECAACYQVPDESLGAEGRKVRCAACRTLWYAKAPALAPHPGDAVAAADETAPMADAPADLLPPEPAQPLPVTRPAPARPWHQRMGQPAGARTARWPLVAGAAAVAALVALFAFRAPLVRLVPEAGRVYAAFGLPVNLSGLEIRQVKSGLLTENGVEMLVVQGEIANVTQVTRIVPRLKFAVLDAKGLPLYSWTAQAETKDLKPGETQTFRRRLASPPPEGQDVLVRFAGKADLLALAQ